MISQEGLIALNIIPFYSFIIYSLNMLEYFLYDEKLSNHRTSINIYQRVNYLQLIHVVQERNKTCY